MDIDIDKERYRVNKVQDPDLLNEFEKEEDFLNSIIFKDYTN